MLFGLRSKLTSVLFVRFPFAPLVVRLPFLLLIRHRAGSAFVTLFLATGATGVTGHGCLAARLLLLYIFKRFFIQFALRFTDTRFKSRLQPGPARCFACLHTNATDVAKACDSTLLKPNPLGSTGWN